MAAQGPTQLLLVNKEHVHSFYKNLFRKNTWLKNTQIYEHANAPINVIPGGGGGVWDFDKAFMPEGVALTLWTRPRVRIFDAQNE